MIITGDACDGIQATKATDNELGKLNKGFDSGSRQSKKFGNDAEREGRQFIEIDRGAGVTTAGLKLYAVQLYPLQALLQAYSPLTLTKIRLTGVTSFK